MARLASILEHVQRRLTAIGYDERQRRRLRRYRAIVDRVIVEVVEQDFARAFTIHPMLEPAVEPVAAELFAAEAAHFRLLFEGDFVGQPFNESNDITAVALSDTDLCMFPRSSFERVLSDRPKLERALLGRVMRSLNEARDRQLTLARKSARARIAGFLCDLAHSSGNDQFNLPISRGDIADYLGLTIETVSRQFTEFKSEGMIAAERGSRSIKILDYAALQSLAAN